jgi:hypothetical protein
MAAVKVALADTDALLGELAGLLADLLGDADETDPVSSATQYGRWWDLYHSLKARHAEGLSVALLALAKSGERPARAHA